MAESHLAGSRRGRPRVKAPGDGVGHLSFLPGHLLRWAQRWPELCPGLTGAPEVLGVADLHVENYGTWRDVEGRLVWGINDFAKPLTSPTPLTWFAWRPAPHWQTVNEAFRYP